MVMEEKEELEEPEKLKIEKYVVDPTKVFLVAKGKPRKDRIFLEIADLNLQGVYKKVSQANVSIVRDYLGFEELVVIKDKDMDIEVKINYKVLKAFLKVMEGFYGERTKRLEELVEFYIYEGSKLKPVLVSVRDYIGVIAPVVV